MARSAQVHRNPAPQNKHLTSRNRRRRVHLRHIHPPTREQQLALIEEARAARRTAGAEGVEAYIPAMERGQE